MLTDLVSGGCFAAPEHAGVVGEVLAVDDVGQVENPGIGPVGVRLDGQVAVALSATCSA